MTWAIIAWLYLAGMSASVLFLIDVVGLRLGRAALFLIAWPITIPFFVVWGFLS